MLRLIQELDSVPSQYLKKLVNTDDIWEVRVQIGNNIFRLLGFFGESDLMILTNGICQKDSKNTILRDLFGRATKTRLLKQEIGR